MEQFKTTFIIEFITEVNQLTEALLKNGYTIQTIPIMHEYPRIGIKYYEVIVTK